MKSIKPNFKVLGPQYGKEMKIIAAKISKLSQADINEFENNKNFVIEVDSKQIELQLNDVEITTKDIDGWLVANQENTTVALDVTISYELRNEGIARELVNRIQNHRKNSGFKVNDIIVIKFTKNSNEKDLKNSEVSIEDAVKNNENYIKAETLANSIIFVENLENGIEIDFDDIQTKMQVSKV